jgi:hypothetical protein
MRSAHTSAESPATIATDIIAQVGQDAGPKLLVFFCHHAIDGAAVSAALRGHYPDAEVIGCTTAGEFTEAGNGTGGTVALTFPPSVATRSASALVGFDSSQSTMDHVARGVTSLEDQLGSKLSTLDPRQYVGIVLVEGLHGREEEVNVALGRAAPFLSFVGGSAGDNLEFKTTRVFGNGQASDDGIVLAVIELAVPFAILKTCSFEPSGRRFKVTRATAGSRTVLELDSRPVLDTYADALGITPGALDSSVFMAHPVGIMIDGQPWIRSPQQTTAEGGLRFYCNIPEGMEVDLMNSTDLVGDTAKAVAAAGDQLGEGLSAALLFDCVLRRLELDATDKHSELLECFSPATVAGFYTYGESWLGHMNQTCTGILFGS